MKRIGFVDKDTGEYCESYVAVIQQKRRNGFQHQGWAAMAQTAFEYLAKNRRFLGEEGFAVFAAMVSQMDFENYIQVNQTEVAKMIGMKRPNVSRAIKKLTDLGVFIEGPRVGRSKTYRLNPNVGWKGSANNHKKELKNLRHLSLVSAPNRDPNTVDFIKGKTDQED